MDYYIEIRVCDNSGKSIIEEYKKTLGNKTDKLSQMKIGDLFAPSTKDIQEAIDAINQEGGNAIHHYGLGLFDSLVSSIDGCFIARNKKVNGNMELYSSSGDGEEKDMIPGTQYSILLPLKEEEQKYSNLNSDIRYTISNTYILDFEEAGIFKPEQAIKVSNPIVFKLTVLPPVLGPVIKSVEKSFPKVKVIGTTLFLSINGWHAFINSIFLSLFKIGVIPSISLEYLAFAKMKSSFAIKFTSFFNSSI